MKLRFTKRAECDLERIREYYEQHAGTSQRVLQEFEAAFEHLKLWPRSGQHRLDLVDERYRFWRVRSYLIVYALDDPWLLIVTVLHASRELTHGLEWLR